MKTLSEQIEEKMLNRVAEEIEKTLDKEEWEKRKDSPYHQWITFRIDRGDKTLTRTENLFAMEIFNNPEIVKLMSNPGDVEGIFKSIHKFLKQ